MANAFPKDVVVAWQESIEKFDSDNIVAKKTDVRRSSGDTQFRGNFREWIPQSMISTTVDGLDITAELGRDVTELAVPFDIDTIPNVPFTLDAQEMNDPAMLRKKLNSAMDALSARLNRDVVNKIVNTGAQTVTQAGALAGYDDVAAAEEMLLRQDISSTMAKTLAMNMRDYRTAAGDLASRTLDNSKSLGAFERSFIGDVAGFDSFRTSFMPSLALAAGAATATGAQSHVPVANATTNGTTVPIDNRFFNLVVSSSAGMKTGDRFTAGVNEVSLINKVDTGELRTFTVTGVVDGTNITISPAPIDFAGATQAEVEYGNVSGPIANAQALTFLNTTTAQVNCFWEEDSIAINAGNLAVEDLGGVNTMTDTTDSGVKLVIANSGVLGSFTNQYRLTGFWGVTNKDPLKNGILLANQ